MTWDGYIENGDDVVMVTITPVRGDGDETVDHAVEALERAFGPDSVQEK